MAWFRTDDGFFFHRKVRAIPKRYRLAAVGLWDLCGSWCQSKHVPGIVPAHIARDLDGTDSVIAALIDAELWHGAGHSCPSCPPITAGYVFHEWDHWQDPKRVDEARAAAAERQRNKRARDRASTQSTDASDTDGTRSEDAIDTDRGQPAPVLDADRRRDRHDQQKRPNVTRDSTCDDDVTLDPALPSPAQPGSSIEEPPPQPSPAGAAAPPGRGQDGTGHAAASSTTDALSPAGGDPVPEWRRRYGPKARNAERWLSRLTDDYGPEIAREVIERALADPETRSLGRLDPATGSEHVHDLVRAVKADQHARRQRTGPRCTEHPEHLAATCGACRADRLARGEERAIGPRGVQAVAS